MLLRLPLMVFAGWLLQPHSADIHITCMHRSTYPYIDAHRRVETTIGGGGDGSRPKMRLKGRLRKRAAELGLIKNGAPLSAVAPATRMAWGIMNGVSLDLVANSPTRLAAESVATPRAGQCCGTVVPGRNQVAFAACVLLNN